MDNLDSYSEYEFMKRFIEPVVNQHVKQHKEEIADLKSSFNELSKRLNEQTLKSPALDKTQSRKRKESEISLNSESLENTKNAKRADNTEGIFGFEGNIDEFTESLESLEKNLSYTLDEFFNLSLDESAGTIKDTIEADDEERGNLLSGGSSDPDTYIEVEFIFPSGANPKSEEKTIGNHAHLTGQNESQEKMEPHRLENIYEKAQEAYLQQNFDDSSNICFFLTIVEPSHSEFWMGLGLSEHMRGNFELAAYAFASAMDVSKEDLSPAIFAAKSLLSLGQKDGAKVLLGKAIDHAGNNPFYADFKDKAMTLKNSI